jgi:uncharacterized protein
MRWILLAFAALCLCGCGEKDSSLEYINSRKITLPAGQEIRAEVMMRPEDMMRGMMFRDSLAPDRGMLFIHGGPGNYPYYMYQVRIPLDIIWMDRNRSIVEISANTPPCTSSASACPTYGGTKTALYVLELAAGMAAKYNLRPGQTLEF